MGFRIIHGEVQEEGVPRLVCRQGRRGAKDGESPIRRPGDRPRHPNHRRIRVRRMGYIIRLRHERPHRHRRISRTPEAGATARAACPGAARPAARAEGRDGRRPHSDGHRHRACDCGTGNCGCPHRLLYRPQEAEVADLPLNTICSTQKRPEVQFALGRFPSRISSPYMR